MNIKLEAVKQELVKFQQLLEPRLKEFPNYNILIFCKEQATYINKLLVGNGTITLEDEKNIHIGIMSVKENLINEDPELDNQIHKLTGSIGKLTGRIKDK